MYNDNINGILMFLDNLTDDDYITVKDLISNEEIDGTVEELYKIIIDKNKNYKNKGKFEIVFK